MGRQRAMKGRRCSLSKVVDPMWIILFRMLKRASASKILLAGKPEPPPPPPPDHDDDATEPFGSASASGSAPMILLNALRCGGSIKTDSLRYDTVIQQYLVEPHNALPHLPSCTSTSRATSSASTSTTTITSRSSSSFSSSSSSSSSCPHHSKPSFLNLPSMTKAYCLSKPRTDSFRVHHLVDHDALDSCTFTSTSGSGRTVEQIDGSIHGVDPHVQEEEDEALHCVDRINSSASGSSRCTLMASSSYSEHYHTPGSSFHTAAHNCSCPFSVSGRIDGEIPHEVDEDVVEEIPNVRMGFGDNAKLPGNVREMSGDVLTANARRAERDEMDALANVGGGCDGVQGKLEGTESDSVGNHVRQESDEASVRAMSGSARGKAEETNGRLKSGGEYRSEKLDGAREDVDVEGAGWVVMDSEDPMGDFSASITEMVVYGKMRKEEDLEALFEELVRANAAELRPTIALAFVDAMTYLAHLSSALPSSPSPLV